MGRKAAITVQRSQDDVRQLWQSSDFRPDVADDSRVSFRDAPGDWGTEIHVELGHEPPAGRLGEAALKLAGSAPLAKLKDELRRFKQLVETGEVARSDGVPEGERAERKLKERPAQPLEEAELAEVGV